MKEKCKVVVEMQHGGRRGGGSRDTWENVVENKKMQCRRGEVRMRGGDGGRGAGGGSPVVGRVTLGVLAAYQRPLM